MINPEKIGELIGPGGKTIRAIQEETGAQIDIQDDGTVIVSAIDGKAAEDALARIEALTEDIKVDASPDAGLLFSWRSYTSGC
jgi:polyribonucleotide nucleotidyltransferase